MRAEDIERTRLSSAPILGCLAVPDWSDKWCDGEQERQRTWSRPRPLASPRRHRLALDVDALAALLEGVSIPAPCSQAAPRHDAAELALAGRSSHRARSQQRQLEASSVPSRADPRCASTARPHERCVLFAARQEQAQSSRSSRRPSTARPARVRRPVRSSLAQSLEEMQRDSGGVRDRRAGRCRTAVTAGASIRTASQRRLSLLLRADRRPLGTSSSFSSTRPSARGPNEESGHSCSSSRSYALLEKVHDVPSSRRSRVK